MPGFYYNVNCPKNYGKVTFLNTSKGLVCPVSSTHFCFECDVIGFRMLNEPEKFQVKKKEEK